MAVVELVMPKMGESIIEATVLAWTKQVGDQVAVDETVLEIATDKVDSEVPSPVAGVLTEIRYQVDAVVAVGEVIAVINTDSNATASPSKPAITASAKTEQPAAPPAAEQPSAEALAALQAPFDVAATPDGLTEVPRLGSDGQFFSPLVRNIATTEGISQAELETIAGSGREGRVTKQDLLGYLQQRSSTGPATVPAVPAAAQEAKAATRTPTAVSVGGSDEIIEMDRMRQLIADHMVNSVRTSPHVTSFVEADVTNLVRWREANKGKFIERHGDKITYTPLFVEAVVRAIADYPMINVQVDGKRIIKKHDINIGMAAALPSGNLIVPVIHKANTLSLVGLSQRVNDLAARARKGKLLPAEVQGGTFTLTNVGTFGNVMGTPIINQPQAAILAVGAIRKRPAVLETPEGDVIAIRHMMFLSLSYDHRVVDGMLGGSFVRRVADYLEQFDTTRSI